MSVLLGNEVLMSLGIQTLVCCVMALCNVLNSVQHFVGQYCLSCIQKLVRGILFVWHGSTVGLISIVGPTSCTFLVYYELTTSTCFEHYLLIFRRHCIHNWYILCIVC
jgi:hypothetical protein